MHRKLLPALLSSAIMMGILSPEAQAQNSASEDAIGAFVLGGSPSGWQFAMGPKGGKNMTLRLVRLTKQGHFAFECRTDGSERVVAVVNGVTAPSGTMRTFDIGIGDGIKPPEVRPLGMVAMAPNSNATSTIFMSDSKAAVALLSAMSNVPEGFPGLFTVTGEDHRGIVTDIPKPRDLAFTSLQVCSAWHTKAEQSGIGFSGGINHATNHNDSEAKASSTWETKAKDLEQKPAEGIGIDGQKAELTLPSVLP